MPGSKPSISYYLNTVQFAGVTRPQPKLIICTEVNPSLYHKASTLVRNQLMSAETHSSYPGHLSRCVKSILISWIHLPPNPPNVVPAAPAQPLPITSKGIQFTKGKAISHLSDQVCEYARNRLRKFKYVEMWYFTRQGLEATKSKNTSIGEGYGFVDTKQGP